MWRDHDSKTSILFLNKSFISVLWDIVVFDLVAATRRLSSGSTFVLPHEMRVQTFLQIFINFRDFYFIHDRVGLANDIFYVNVANYNC